ncbi:hypothetical protein ACLOJK_007779 [Asimina triloba]
MAIKPSATQSVMGIQPHHGSRGYKSGSWIAEERRRGRAVDSVVGHKGGDLLGGSRILVVERGMKNSELRFGGVRYCQGGGGSEVVGESKVGREQRRTGGSERRLRSTLCSEKFDGYKEFFLIFHDAKGATS